jgi:hypothetical protein
MTEPVNVTFCQLAYVLTCVIGIVLTDSSCGLAQDGASAVVRRISAGIYIDQKAGVCFIKGQPHAPARLLATDVSAMLPEDFVELRLEWVDCGPGTIKSLLESRRFRAITCVGTNFVDSDVVALLKSSDSLEFVNLSQCWMTSLGVSQLKVLTHLKVLYLEGLPLVDVDTFSALTKSLPNTTVKW